MNNFTTVEAQTLKPGLPIETLVTPLPISRPVALTHYHVSKGFLTQQRFIK